MTSANYLTRQEVLTYTSVTAPEPTGGADQKLRDQTPGDADALELAGLAGNASTSVRGAPHEVWSPRPAPDAS
jgi:hypothetical protein